MRIYFVTGVAGFIGSNFVLRQRRLGRARIINLDLLTYAGNPMSLEPVRSDPDYIFVHGDIGDRELVRDILKKYKPDSVINFSAESHVDLSIEGTIRAKCLRLFSKYLVDLPCKFTR